MATVCLPALALMAVPPPSQQSDEEIFFSLCFISILFIIFLWIWPAVWMYRDAKRRGKEQVLWLLIGLIAPVIGPIVWAIVRHDPDKRLVPAPYYAYPPPQYYPPVQYYPPTPSSQYQTGTRYQHIEVAEVDTDEGYSRHRYGR